MFPILGSMQLRSWAFQILAAMDVSITPRKFLANPRLSFWEGEEASLRPSVYCVLIIYVITVSEQ